MMRDKDPVAADTAWFDVHAHSYVRRAFPIERAQAIAADNDHANGVIIVLVTQVEPGVRIRRMISVPSNELADYAVRNGTDCIGVDGGKPYVLLPGSILNGRVLQ
jgi:hypothetical protein